MKTVLITGSARGIGRAIALKFARGGYRVALNCVRSRDAMAELIDEISAFNPYVAGVCADVSDYTAAKELFVETEAKLGEVDILINNAGISKIGLFNEMKPLEWDDVLRVNLNSVINCSHLAVPGMIRRKQGCIINISSIWGITGASCEVIYSASKAAVNGFTSALAKELGPCNIRVNAVACGVIDTAMNDCFSEDEKTALRDEIPLGRLGTVNDIAELVYFLSSNAAAFITGKIITSDGGWL